MWFISYFEGVAYRFFSHVKEKNLCSSWGRMNLGKKYQSDSINVYVFLYWGKAVTEQEDYKGLLLERWQGNYFSKGFSFVIIFNFIGNRDPNLYKCNVENCNYIMHLHQDWWKKYSNSYNGESIPHGIMANGTRPHLTSTFITVLEQVFKLMKNNFPFHKFYFLVGTMTCSNKSQNSHFSLSSFPQLSLKTMRTGTK